MLALEPWAMVMAEEAAEAARGHTGRRWLDNTICTQGSQVQRSLRQAGAGRYLAVSKWLRQWGRNMLQVIL